MQIISMFDGISCGLVGLERAGFWIDDYLSFEIDPNAIKISNHNYPSIERCGDVIGHDYKKYRGFDLLIGGSPCQSLSITMDKRRTHLDGKSKLFFEFARAKEEINPKYFLFENVASMNQESKHIISEYLGCKPILIDSGDYSAQERLRLYWTNIPQMFNAQSKLVLKDILQSDVPAKYYYDCEYEFHGLENRVCATLDIKGHDIIKRVLSPNFKCHTLTAVCGGNQHKKVFDTIKNQPRKLTPLEYERLQTLPDGYTACVSDTARYKAIGNGWTVDVIAKLLEGMIT